MKFKGTQNNEKSVEIGLIAVGGAGSNIVNYILNHASGIVSTMVIDSDNLTLRESIATKKIQLSQQVSEENVSVLISMERRDIIKFMRKHHILVVIAGMGRNTGTYATVEVLRLAAEENICACAMTTAPFGFEGEFRDMLACRGEELAFSTCRSVSICLNESAEIDLGKSASLTKLFEHTHQHILKQLKRIDEIYYNGWSDVPEYSASFQAALKGKIQD